MAKAKPSEADASDLEAPNPNAPQAGDPPSLWSAEDMARLDQSNTALQQLVTELRGQVEQLQNRFTSQELLLSKVDLGEGILPVEVASGVKPAEVYLAALQASLLGAFIGNPVGMVSNKLVRDANMKKVFELAECALNESLRRTMLKKK